MIPNSHTYDSRSRGRFPQFIGENVRAQRGQKGHNPVSRLFLTMTSVIVRNICEGTQTLILMVLGRVVDSSNLLEEMSNEVRQRRHNPVSHFKVQTV